MRRKGVEQSWEESRGSEQFLCLTEWQPASCAGFSFCPAIFFPWVCKCSGLRFSFWTPVPVTTIPSQCKNQVRPNKLGNCDKMTPTPQHMETVLVTGGRAALLYHSVKHEPKELPFGLWAQGRRLHRVHVLFSHHTNHHWAHWVRDQSQQSKPQWHAMSILPFHPTETATWGREKNITGTIIYSHMAGMRRTHFLVGCYQDGHPARG